MSFVCVCIKHTHKCVDFILHVQVLTNLAHCLVVLVSNLVAHCNPRLEFILFSRLTQVLLFIAYFSLFS